MHLGPLEPRRVIGRFPLVRQVHPLEDLAGQLAELNFIRPRPARVAAQLGRLGGRGLEPIHRLPAVRENIRRADDSGAPLDRAVHRQVAQLLAGPDEAAAGPEADLIGPIARHIDVPDMLAV